MLKRSVRPRSAAGRSDGRGGSSNTQPDKITNTMQVLPPEPPRPVSALPVLQPIPRNKLSIIDSIGRQRGSAHAQGNGAGSISISGSTKSSGLASFATTGTTTDEQTAFSQEQRAHVFLTDVRSGTGEEAKGTGT